MFKSGEPRLLFVALLSSGEIVGETSFLEHEAATLGSRAFHRDNLHQSLSDRYVSTPDNIARMQRAGSRISAHQVTMSFSRVISGAGAAPIHRALRTRGRPEGFDALLEAIQAALMTEGMERASNNTPHVTISYRAPAGMPTRLIKPLAWTITKVQLVEGGGSPYRYQVLGEWDLIPRFNPQMALGF